MSGNLATTFRPTLFKQVIGQDANVKMMTKWVKSGSVPKVVLFTGPAGCGKTTLARILARKLKCRDNDLIEVDGSQRNGVNDIRELSNVAGYKPMRGEARVIIIDECHQLSKQAQSAALKLLEEPPKHTWIFLATTDPQKLSDAIRTRAPEIKLQPLTREALQSVISSALEKLEVQLDEEVFDTLIDASRGSARRALMLLEKVYQMDSDAEQLELLTAKDAESMAIDLCRALTRKNTAWKDIAKILRELKADPEQVRWSVLGYCNSILLKGQNDRIAEIMDCFTEPYFNSGKAGLTLSCYGALFGE